MPAGQVTGLCGDNGAGKTVLTKCIAGINQPDGGQVYWEGRPVHIRSARDALTDKGKNRRSANQSQATPDRSAADAEDKALREQLIHNSAPTGAERRPQRHLALPLAHPGKQQVGDVATRN